VFFAGGFLRGSVPGSAPTADAAVAVRTLGLDDQQQAAYGRLRESTLTNAKPVREAMFAAGLELMDQLDSPAPDPDRVRDIMEFQAEQGRRLRMVAAEHTVQFVRMLTPQQRHMLMQALRNRQMAPPGPWVRPLDTNRDGRLSEEERTAVRQDFQRRWPEIERRRPWMFGRFDTDGDGRLSDEERAAAGRALEACRGGPPWR
jgi:uncharacterized membrane protein